MEENVVVEPVSEKKASDTIKKIITSKSFLFVVICAVVSLVFQIIQAAQNQGVLSNILAMIPSDVPLEGMEILFELADTLDTVLFVFALIGMLPVIALTVGYCLFYIGGIKSDNKLITYACYCVLGFSIFNMIMPIIYLILILVGAIMLITMEMEIFVVVLLALTCALPFIILLNYYQKLNNMLVGVTLTLKHDKNLLAVESYVISWNWVVAIFGILGAITSLATDFVAFLSGIVSAVCLIIVTRMFSKYKKEHGIPPKKEIKAYMKKK